MKISIAFADLTHTKQGISSISFPLGISLVAAYAKKRLGDKIKAELFKYPEDFKEYLEKENPKIVCFSNFSWTLDISYEFAKKIKKKHPEIIIIFGGPNYPNEADEQKKFLFNYPEIDFYIEGEGEQGFADLLESLEKFNFDTENFKKDRVKIGDTHYTYHGEVIKGEILPRMVNLDDIPSPYLSGLLDKFFDGVLTPVIQTTRGCPFNCAYCQESQVYFNKISRFSSERVKEELGYIAKKVDVPNLIITDSNLGMYKEDLETCKNIASLKKKYNWPEYIETNLGKNKKIVVEAVNILGGGICLSAPVQSTDEIVLENIHRRNISMEQIIEITKGGESAGANSFSEVILCLPGDTKQAHFKSMFDMIDAGINVVRSHQLLMLPSSEIFSRKLREKYKMMTRFRIQPRCFGNYKLYNETFPVSEIDEICVANSTMPYEDYLRCRSFDLTVEIFHNNGIFQEPINYLKLKGISTSEFIKNIEQKIPQSSLKELYDKFLKETDESLWKSKAELENFIKQPGMVERYIRDELRNNEQLKYRASAFFTRMKDLHNIAFSSAKELLKQKGNFDEREDNYLDELFEFSLMRKNNLLLLDSIERKKFHYDFIKLLKTQFNEDYSSYSLPKGVDIEFKHSDGQKELISKYVKQYGSSMNGLGIILSRSHTNKFYREAKLAKSCASRI